MAEQKQQFDNLPNNQDWTHTTAAGRQLRSEEIIDSPVSAERQVEAADGWQNVYDTWKLPDDMLERHAQQLDVAIADVKASALTPDLSEAFETAGDYWRWRMTGARGEALPDSLVLRRAPIGNIWVAPHPATAAAAYGDYVIFDEFEHRAEKTLAKLLAEAKDYRFFDTVKTVYPVIRTMIEASPAGQLLRSFETPPDATLQDRPLNPFERQVKEAETVQQVQHKFGSAALSDVQHPQAHTAHNVLQKRLLQLDDARTKSRTPDQAVNNPWQRALMFFSKNFVEFLDQKQITTNSISYIDGKPAFHTNEGVYDFSLPYMDGFSNWLAIKLGEDTTYGVNISAEIFDKVLFKMNQFEAAHHPEPTGHLESVVTEAVDEVRQRIHDHIVNALLANDPYVISMLRPQAPIYEGEYSATAKLPNAQTQLGSVIVSRQEYQAARRQVFADVQRAKDAPPDPLPRLLIPDYQPATQLPEQVDQADVTLHVLDQQRNHPLIPGYELVAAAKTRGMYQFNKLPTADDPYQVCDVALPEDILHILARENEQGMTGFAARLKSGEVRTVDDFVAALQAESDYSFDDSGELRPLKNGRLQVQCSGAAYELQQDLRRLFGAGCAQTLVGQVIRPGQKQVLQIGHAQVLFVYAGKRYILDATPTLDSGPGGGLPTNGPAADAEIKRRRGLLGRFKKLAKPALQAVEEPTDDPPDVHSLPPGAEATKPEPVLIAFVQYEAEHVPDAAKLLSSLRANLQPLFTANNPEELLVKLQKLSDDDPVKRVMRMSYQAVDGQVDATALRDLTDYVKAYPQAGPEFFKKYQLKRYDAAVFSLLERQLAALAKTLSA